MCEHLAIKPATPTQSSWAPTRVQIGAGVVGVIIALVSISEGPAVAGVLRLVGYPIACAAIVRWIPIVRHRRVDWLVAHELGMGAICLGWALVPQWSSVAVNGSWGVCAVLSWAILGRRAQLAP